eukprot:CAMPEP_0173148702 /NCGR_PEP_ID=MMETSP1105-20130129/9877_1 /TAXON_ID=2985 /ORGANISM="Ochromonas sp., Strain BG-1" /LENGTH=490 /DNA_ID=CAMNT_0014063407 /DNA_START=339 /DNA_END=1811 /DNA_ORIENTATION=+
MVKHDDPMIRDKKELPFSNIVVAFVVFIPFLLIITPLWLVVLLPLTVVWQIIDYVKSSIVGRKKPKSSFVVEDPKAVADKVVKVSTAVKDRVYDLVVFGATGFTGKLAAAYLAKQYGTTVRWAIAGRRREALEKVRNDLVKYNAALKDLPIVIADSFDEASLNKLAASTKVVITTAGPFSIYGAPLVKSCALHGTHYCDITGETDWFREMIDQFDDAAKKSGAKIVSFCGHDCIPWDISALKAAKFLKAKGESLTSIHFYDTITAQASGGTFATMNHVLSNRTKYKSFLGFDPLLKTVSGDKSNNKLKVLNQLTVAYSKEHGCWTGPFVMSMVMANCVRRGNAYNNYGSKVEYKEVQTFPNFFAAYTYVVGLLVFGTAFFLPPLHYILNKYVLPQPGEGPSEAFMDTGFLKVDGYAVGSNGSKVKTMIYFPTDPGYRDTARMLVESGLALALESDKLKGGGGIFTPGTCQGEVLLERLISTGSAFEISEA